MRLWINVSNIDFAIRTYIAGCQSRRGQILLSQVAGISFEKSLKSITIIVWVILVDYANQFWRSDKEFMDAIVIAGNTRFVPIILTTAKEQVQKYRLFCVNP